MTWLQISVILRDQHAPQLTAVHHGRRNTNTAPSELRVQ